MTTRARFSLPTKRGWIVCSLKCCKHLLNVTITTYHCEDTNAKNMCVCNSHIRTNFSDIYQSRLKDTFRNLCCNYLCSDTQYISYCVISRKHFFVLCDLHDDCLCCYCYSHLCVKNRWIHRLFYLSMRTEVRIYSLNMQNKIQTRGRSKTSLYLTSG